MDQGLMEKIVSLARRRGFVYPGSEIYGGLANTWDFGPLGVELLRNIQNLWWKTFVQQRSDMYGMDSSILMNPKVWEASGHVASFTDVMVDCRSCKLRTRADHLLEDAVADIKVEGLSPQELENLINKYKVVCPNCHEFNWTAPRKFNLLFETKVGIIPEEQSLVYLRGEIAQGMFVNFKNILDSFSPKLPFGLAQSGKAFRNEITKGNFIFRTLEFYLAELEYFFNPSDGWQKYYDSWKEEVWNFYTNILGISPEKLRWREHTPKERAHYSIKTEDLEFEFPFGFKEIFGQAYRTDFDLKNHMEKSGVSLKYHDPFTGEEFIPHVIEPSFGINRAFLAIMVASFTQEEQEGKKRFYLKFDPRLAPYKAAVFPLLANKPQLVEKAKDIYLDLKKDFMVAWDDRGNIGKRYASQDEIGTPFCLTVDFKSLEDNTITVRYRDTAKQERIKIEDLLHFLSLKI